MKIEYIYHIVNIISKLILEFCVVNFDFSTFRKRGLETEIQKMLSV